MTVINLMEDTRGTAPCRYEHGLSFYIETAHHKVLLDTGATDAFLYNAEQKGIDLTKVDTVILSHGHYDHTGGLLAFTEINPTATVYLSKYATGAFYNLKNGQIKYIGMDPKIAALPRICWTEGNLRIDDELSLFTGVKGRYLWPKGNLTLCKKVGDAFLQDEFDHEQYLVVTEGDRQVLLSGCAHNGILNILETYRSLYGSDPTHVISGFHTAKPSYTPEDDALLFQTAAALAKTKTLYYTGHCTGDHPMQIFRSVLGDRLIPIHSGDRVV